MAVSPLHYMYNVMQQNGCFPLFIRVSGVFAILPVIIPCPLSLYPLLIPCLAFLVPSLPFPVVFWGRVPGKIQGRSWEDPGRSKQIREDPGRSQKVPEDPGRSWEDPRRSKQIREDPGRSQKIRASRASRTSRTSKIGLYLRFNQLVNLFDTLPWFICLGRSGAKKRRFLASFYRYFVLVGSYACLYAHYTVNSNQKIINLFFCS